MKTTPFPSVRIALYASVVAVLSATTVSAHNQTPTDLATAQLAHNGHVAIRSAGPYVEAGTPRIQVTATLGRPSMKLSDATWLYDHHLITESDARARWWSTSPAARSAAWSW